MDIISLFARLFNVSFTASILAVAVMLLRLIFKKAPKGMTVLLWALVAIRLICPFSLESDLSLIPTTEVIPEAVLQIDPTKDNVTAYGFLTSPIYTDRINSTVVVDNVDSFQWDVLYASAGWLIGMVVLLIYALISFLRLRYKVRTAIPLRDNIWICDEVKTPFILGLFRPRIYLPSDMDEETSELVLRHEKAHLKRKDHLWKPLGFILLCIYWFNPVMWLSYILLCRDIELACDEKVIKDMQSADKKAYSEALLSCSVPSRMISACPVAFGEVGVKKRIRSILNYKKPAFWVIVVALVASIAVAVCFMTDPKSENGGKNYIEGISEIDEVSFNMKEILDNASSFVVYESGEDYFEATRLNGFAFSDIENLLDSIYTSPLPDGMVNPTHEVQFDILVKIPIMDDALNFDGVSIVFHDDFQKMYMTKWGYTYNSSLDYSVRSQDYTVLNVEEVRDFFVGEAYKTHLTWAYDLTSSQFGCLQAYFYLDEKFELSGEIEGEGVISLVENTDENLKGFTWRPEVDKTLDRYDIYVPVTYEGKNTVFELQITKAGQKKHCTYFRIYAPDTVVSSWDGGYEFLLSLPESANDLQWYYNPMLSAVGYSKLTFTLPDGYSLASRNVLQDGVDRFFNYSAEEEISEFVWFPDEYTMTEMCDTKMEVFALKDGEVTELEFTIKPMTTDDRGGTFFKIEPENCNVRQEQWATYLLEEK